MNITYWVFAAVALLASAVLSISVIGQNSLEFRVAASEESESFFENRLDLRVSESFLTLGARFEAMHPSRISAITRPGEEYAEFTHLWARVSIDNAEFTGGTILESFGNGTILDALERPEIQEDRHIEGISVRLKLPFSSLKLLGGIADWNEIDYVTIKGFDLQVSDIHYINFGAGYIAYENKMEEGEILPSQHGEVWGVRAMPQFGAFYGEAQYSRGWRNNIAGGDFAEGGIFYGNTSFFLGSFVFFGEYLQADGFPARGYDENSWLISLPLIVHQPAYALMSRHLKEIDPRDSRAFSGEISTSIERGDILLSAASVSDIDGEKDAYYEIYGSFGYEFDKISAKFVTQYQELAGDDWAMNLVLEPLLYLTDRSALILDFEFQTAVEYGENITNLYGSAEYSLSPHGSIGIEGGRIGEDSELFARGYIDFNLGAHKLTLGYGKRPGGWTCSGGSCRYEPEFEGFEFKLLSNF
ncbi:MAG TPA: hypothetical protein ENN07_05090 [candidate division Zixibacteria bacterium]|nr:hypothetical protein [candidate division Zixibacteria bacterium]